MQKLILILSIFFLGYSYSFSEEVSLCKALNALNVYSPQNIGEVQKYLKNSFFPGILVTNKFDTQTIVYLKKFQYSFGLQVTGKLNVETLEFLQEKNSCFSLKQHVMDIEKGSIVRKILQNDILQSLIQLAKDVASTTTNTSNGFTITVSSTTQAQLEYQKTHPPQILN